MLWIGAALLVGGLGGTQYARQQGRLPKDDGFGGPYVWWQYERLPYISGLVSMTVGTGLIGFAVLRPTNSNDE